MIFAPIVLEPSHARAALRTEVARAAPGRPFLAAVEIDTDPKWHVYWKNPGDSGIPTTVVWSAPKGWRVEPLEYPAPHRFAPGGVAAYGYEGRTLLLARVTPSATPGLLSAKVRRLVCSEACVAGGATPSAKVPLGATPSLGAQSSRLRMAAASLPRPIGPRWTAKAVGGKSVSLTVAPPAGMRALPGSLQFFPLESGVIDQANPYVATLQGRAYVFKMEPSPFPERRARLRGLLVPTPTDGRSALIVDPKLEKETHP